VWLGGTVRIRPPLAGDGRIINHRLHGFEKWVKGFGLQPLLFHPMITIGTQALRHSYSITPSPLLPF
jgi:hypothetical protein